MTKKGSLFFWLLILLAGGAVHGQNLRLDKYQNRPQALNHVRVASASVLPDKWHKEKNWPRIEAAVQKAACEGGAQVVITPEGVLEGYVINDVNREKDPAKKRALAEQFLRLGEPIDGPYIQKACSLADTLNVFFVLGFLEKRISSLYNTVILIDPDGDIIGKYSKTHFAQGYAVNPDFYGPGREYPVFSTPFGKVGLLICYDRQLPEPARILALKGAQILFVPSFGSYTDENGWNTALLRTRAYENKFPLVFCNPYQSLMIADSGDLKAVGQAGEIVYCEFNTSPDRTNERFDNRRPALYRELSSDLDPAEKKVR